MSVRIGRDLPISVWGRPECFTKYRTSKKCSKCDWGTRCKHERRIRKSRGRRKR